MSETGLQLKIAKRPIIITIACIWIFLYAVLSIFLYAVLAPLAIIIPQGIETLVKLSGSGIFIAVAILANILDIVAGVGYWKMKKWGVYFYIIAIIVGHVGSFLSLQKAQLSIVDIVPFGIVGIGLLYFRRMA